jgi:hypothetical protein
MVWDLGILLEMIMNDRLDEIQVIGTIITLMVGFIPTLLFHFSNLYTGRPIKWAIILVWIVTGALWVLTIFGYVNKVVGVYTYQWGNIHRYGSGVFDYVGVAVWFVFNLWAFWLLLTGRKRTSSDIERRHYLYITSGVLVITFAIVKAGVALGINLPFLLPLGMFLVDALNAIIGMAIIKDKLFDITVIIKRGTLYSILAAILIFVYSFVEHILVTFVGERVGAESTFLHLIAVAIGIAVLMPIKRYIEHSIDRYFAQRKLVF